MKQLFSLGFAFSIGKVFKLNCPRRYYSFLRTETNSPAVALSNWPYPVAFSYEIKALSWIDLTALTYWRDKERVLPSNGVTGLAKRLQSYKTKQTRHHISKLGCHYNCNPGRDYIFRPKVAGLDYASLAWHQRKLQLQLASRREYAMKKEPSLLSGRYPVCLCLPFRPKKILFYLVSWRADRGDSITNYLINK